MTSLASVLPELATAALTLAGFLQAGAGWRAVHCFGRRTVPPGPRPAVTMLKPLHGDEPLLEEALASFCDQDYPAAIQVVFGVQDAADGAVAAVRRVQARFPHLDIDLVVDPTPHGVNRKIANLVNMFPSARHDVLLIADSDMHVRPDYLRRVTDTLAEPGVGLVTTLYAGRPARAGLAGWLGAAYITQTFSTGAVMAARWLGRQDCMGATMALTRETLMRAGGLPSLSPYVADDAVLGAKVRALGLRVALAACVPATTVAETTVASLFRHELRWARTIRAVEPLGFALSCVQFPAFWALLTVMLSGGALWAMALWVMAVAWRGVCGAAVERTMGAARTPLWMPALRDVLSMTVLLCAYMGDRVAWRGHVLDTSGDTHFGAARVLLAARRG